VAHLAGDTTKQFLRKAFLFRMPYDDAVAAELLGDPDNGLGAVPGHYVHGVRYTGCIEDIFGGSQFFQSGFLLYPVQIAAFEKAGDIARHRYLHIEQMNLHLFFTGNGNCFGERALHLCSAARMNRDQHFSHDLLLIINIDSSFRQPLLRKLPGFAATCRLRRLSMRPARVVPDAGCGDYPPMP
jgi:hypothetical protein